MHSVPDRSGAERAARRTRWRFFLLKSGLWILFLIGFSLRIYHCVSPFRTFYMNDMGPHTIYIHYVHEHRATPPPGAGFEFGQEPLYYWLVAPFYNSALSEDDNQPGLAIPGTALSLASLIILYGSLKYLSSWLVRYGLLIFMGVTPSFVLHSACVGNDGLVAFFGALYFYLLQRFNRHPGRGRLFWPAIAALMLELFTKLNGAVLALSLPWLLWRSERNRFFTWKVLLRGAIVAVLIGGWLWCLLGRAWLPDEKRFHFLQWTPYPGQTIDVNFVDYTLDFNLSHLLVAGETPIYTSKVPKYVAPVDSVRFSYPTWVFGNMLVGDWDYNESKPLLEASRTVILFGTIFPLGFLLFTSVALLGWPITSQAGFSALNKTALVMVTGMICLSLHLVLTLPTICHADFRFAAPAFPWAGYCFSRGFLVFPRGRALRTLAMVFLTGYVISCFTFYWILYHTPNVPGFF